MWPLMRAWCCMKTEKWHEGEYRLWHWREQGSESCVSKIFSKILSLKNFQALWDSMCVYVVSLWSYVLTRYKIWWVLRGTSTVDLGCDNSNETPSQQWLCLMFDNFYIPSQPVNLIDSGIVCYLTVWPSRKVMPPGFHNKR